jgi:hypothetical protein
LPQRLTKPQASCFAIYRPYNLLTHFYILLADYWEQYVHSEVFDKECKAALSKSLLSHPNVFTSNSSKRTNLWENDKGEPSLTSVGSSSHAVSKLEAHLYYFGIRGYGHRGPKLIYRTSEDVFMPPFGPEQDARIMQLLPIYYHDKLGKDNLWATVRDEVRIPLK